MERGPVDGIAGVPATQEGACPNDSVDDNIIAENSMNRPLALMYATFFFSVEIDGSMSGRLGCL